MFYVIDKFYLFHRIEGEDMRIMLWDTAGKMILRLIQNQWN